MPSTVMNTPQSTRREGRKASMLSSPMQMIDVTAGNTGRHVWHARRGKPNAARGYRIRASDVAGMAPEIGRLGFDRGMDQQVLRDGMQRHQRLYDNGVQRAARP